MCVVLFFFTPAAVSHVNFVFYCGIKVIYAVFPPQGTFVTPLSSLFVVFMLLKVQLVVAAFKSHKDNNRCEIAFVI